MTDRIAVLGGGTWGATLANQLAKNGHAVSMWEFAAENADYLNKHRSLKTLPDLKLLPSIEVTNDIVVALKNKNVVLSVTPSHAVRATFKAALEKTALSSEMLFISATKGIENESLLTMSQVISQVFPDAKKCVILSGPSHAEEVALGRPVAMVAASTNEAAALQVKAMFSSDNFRVYTGVDPLGVELGGSIKNVYALACGIVDGLDLGDNTKAALMSRGLLEMTRLGSSLGAKTVTFFGLTGLGDLIVTCASKHSRNRSLGEKIGRGKKPKDALAEMTMVAEGVVTAKSAYNLSKKQNIDMPIVNEVYKILFEEKPPKDSMKDLMSREVGEEMEGITL